MARHHLKVAVIGAGVGGLVTARELKREGLEVVVYEKSNQIGGLWVYDPRVEEEDLLGLNPNREIVHSSLYRSVRTTIPRMLMGFSDYPFPICRDQKGISSEFPGHEEVLKFLNNFARDFGIIDLVRFNTEVVRVEQLTVNAMWVVGWRSSESVGGLTSEEWFDAVVVCNGHFTEPKLAGLPGINKWPGKQIHSHNYRVPEPFREQVVVIIGDGPSGRDISQDIGKVAKEVHISSRAPGVVCGKMETFDNLWQHSKIEYCFKNGEIAFEDGAVVAAHTIVHCTGYKYHIPFLKTNGIVSVDGDRVGPLYKHIFPPQLAPWLSFVGIPNRAANFHMMEIQAMWVAGVLSGKAILPSKEDMLEDVEAHYQQMKDTGLPKHQTHRLPLNQYEYLDWVKAQLGLPPVDDEVKETMANLFKAYDSSEIKFREIYFETKMSNGNADKFVA